MNAQVDPGLCCIIHGSSIEFPNKYFTSFSMKTYVVGTH